MDGRETSRDGAIMTAPMTTANDSGVPHPNRLVVSLLILLLLGLMAILIGLVFGVRGGNLATLVLCSMTAVFAFVPIVVDQARSFERRKIILSLFCLAFVGRYVIPPIILYVPEKAPIDAPGMYLSMLRPWDVAAGQFVVLLALVSFLVGHAIPLLRMMGPGFPTPRKDWSPATTFGVGVALVLFGWPITLASAFGVIPAALGSGVVSTLGSSMIYGNVLLALAYFRYGLRSALFFLLITIPMSSLVGFLSGSKTATLLPPAFVALTYVFERRRVPLTFVMVGTLTLAVVYPASEYVRAYLLHGGMRSAAQVLSDPGSATSEVGDYVRSRDFGDYLGEGFSSVAARLDSTGVVSVIARDTPRLSPYQHGSTLILFFISFAPRVFWPEKPDIGIGQFITDVYGSGPEIDSSTGPSQIGDYYLNFGHAGVIVGMLSLGIAFRFVDDLLMQGRRRPTAAALLAAIAVVFSIIITFETNAALAQARVFFIVTPIIALHMFVRQFAGAKIYEASPNT